MVSDMVLLKELPESIKNSIDAYLGCLAGAIMKKDYLDAIGQAGFQRVGILSETPLPFELVNEDPMVKSIIDNLKIPTEMVRDISSTFVSIKVCGIK